jgi:hypothetical protein
MLITAQSSNKTTAFTTFMSFIEADISTSQQSRNDAADSLIAAKV